MPRKKAAVEKVQPVKNKVPKKAKVPAGLNIPVYNISGQEVGTAALSKAIFDIKANPKLLAQYVRVYLANQRQGTASAKTRGEVGGSTRKIYRQKGTGRARHGSRKAPIFVGGGVVGGPKPKDHFLKMNKKQRQMALFYALTLKRKDIIGLSESKIEPKTKIVVNFLKNLKLYGTNSLLVMPKSENTNLILASRNITGIKIINATLINAYEIMKTNKIIMLKTALTDLEKHFLKS